jgi:hypothetical protein
LRHHDAILGTLRGAGVSIELAGHACALLDAYSHGFALTEAAHRSTPRPRPRSLER